MNTKVYGIHQKALIRAIIVAAGIFMNIGLSFLISRLNWPIYLDTTGTITVSAFGGVFPGIMTAVLTNAICTSFNNVSIYFTIVNVSISIYTYQFVKRRNLRSFKNVITYTLGVALISTALSTVIQIILFNGPQNVQIAEIVDSFVKTNGTSKLVLTSLATLFLNIVDKWISVMAAILIMHLIPKDIQDVVVSSGWRQRPLTKEEFVSMKEWDKDIKHSIRTRTTVLISGISLALVAVMLINGFTLFYQTTLESSIENAKSATSFAAEVLDPELVDDFIAYGEEAEGYKETLEMFSRILESSAYVKYLYAMVVRADACYAVLDVETPDTPPYSPGEKIPIEEAFYDSMPALLAGEEIPPIESVNAEGWLTTIYKPVYDRYGNCVCYIGADISMEKAMDSIQSILIKLCLTISGFFFLIVVTGMWVSDYTTVYPINSIAEQIDKFSSLGYDQKQMDQYVRKIRQLDIRTGDEIEKMYNSICRLAATTAEQLRDIRYYGDTTSKMQSGLIITMADLVENRDSDTGSHIQKTAEYVRIVMEGLKDKGYYSEKLTPKFMEDVVMSAPLHDVGKINIPDAVLNKPGKLTEEEFAIMKTHTTCGKLIMEKAISTVRGEGYLKEARNMAAYHHEKWDGTGYPEGLHGEIIPLSARIMAVADVFDALTSPRVYKPAFPVDKALEIITNESGKQFDPKCVEAFMSRLPEVKKVLKKYGQL